MNILFICPDRTDPTSFYRAGGIAHDLERQSGAKIVVAQHEQIVVNWQVISDFDVLMLQRPFTTGAVTTIKYAKEMNRKIWIDYDDNLFELNPENKAFTVYNNQATKENIKQCLKYADVVSVPTEYLRQIYLPYNQNIKIVPNAFNDDIFVRKEPLPRQKKVLWRGPESHIYDIMNLGQYLNKASEDFPDFEFIFMGYYPWFLSKTNNKSFMQGLDIIMFYHKLQELAPAALHVPLHDNAFNRCRSNTAYIEGTWAGAVCIVPSWWSVPGALSYTDGPSYYEALRTCLSGEVDLAKMVAEAWEYIWDCLRLSKVNAERLQIINNLKS